MTGHTEPAGSETIPAPPVIVGILNITPDSFSDGGSHDSHDDAIRAAVDMVSVGADIIDVGGESSRPGAKRISPMAEQERVIPVIRELVQRGIVVSVDTWNAGTAERAIEAGVHYVNDVTGGLRDPEMADVIRNSAVDYIVSHWGGGTDVSRMGKNAINGVKESLLWRLLELTRSGIGEDRIILDPGLGFGKDTAQNWELISDLSAWQEMGPRILVGHSRKRFIASLLPEDAPMNHRDLPTAVVSVLAAQAGVWGVRVHDVRSTRRAFDVLDAVADASAFSRVSANS